MKECKTDSGAILYPTGEQHQFRQIGKKTGIWPRRKAQYSVDGIILYDFADPRYGIIRGAIGIPILTGMFVNGRLAYKKAHEVWERVIGPETTKKFLNKNG